MTKNGYEIAAEAENGKVAVDKYKEAAPDLTLMDITMPEMDGIQALKGIKAIDPSANVIMCSAMGQQAMVIEAIQSGAKDFIVKPFQAERVLEAVKACREAVGNDFDLILECHRSLSPSEAIAFANGVEQYHPLFLEDPIAPDNIDAMADIAQRTNIPVATGERFINIQEFEMLMKRNGAKYVRPDVCALGGITPCKKVAAIAEANYVQIVPHNPLGPVSTAACLQLDASIPNFAIQEFPSFYHQGNESRMTKEPLCEEEGYIIVPNGAGIGIELVDDICEQFPQKQRSISAQIAFDGSVYDI